MKQRVAALVPLLIPVALAGAIVATADHGTLYDPSCTVALFRALSSQSSTGTCDSVPLSGDWPSVAGGFVALAMFVLYRRLSVILGRLSEISKASVFRADPPAPSPGDLGSADFWSRVPQPTRNRLPTTDRYAWSFRRRAWAFAAATTLGIGMYSIAYNRGDWFDILSRSRHVAEYRSHWWANWHTHPAPAVLWILVAAVTIYIGMDNFLTSSRVARDLRVLFGEDTRSELPFVANIPARSDIWQHLHSLLGEMQYGSLTALGSVTIASILVVQPNSNTWVALVVLADLLFVVGLTARFVILKQTLENACMAIMDGEIQRCEDRRKAAAGSANFAEAEYWSAISERVLKYGPLPVLAARQIAIRLIVVVAGSLSLIATIAQTLD